jgi:hypothetical protein
MEFLRSTGHISNPQTLNRYSYVANNPENAIDPSGLDASGSDGCSIDEADVNCGVLFRALSIGGPESGDAAADDQVRRSVPW